VLQVVDLLEAEAFRRALNGRDELLAFLLRAWLPEQYEEIVGVGSCAALKLFWYDSDLSSIR
jgi:hypothetical protein